MVSETAQGDAQCVVRTFELTCARQDPWGCQMLGLVLARGFGVMQDFDRALQVLLDACRLGEDDPACEAAHMIETEIREAKITQPGP